MTTPREESPPIRPRQFGLRALFRVTLYCAIASAILRLIPVATLQDLGGLGGLLLVGVLLTLPTLAVLLVISLVAWLVERL